MSKYDDNDSTSSIHPKVIPAVKKVSFKDGPSSSESELPGQEMQGGPHSPPSPVGNFSHSAVKGEKKKALFFYALLILIFYAPVFLSGKTLLPTSYQPGGVTAEGIYGKDTRTPVNSFSVDIATPAYYEFPINKLVGDMIKGGELPLWNPYQAAGTPLLAQYSTRALFPYQILENISPVAYWDFFLLGRLLIAGFFTFLFLRVIGLSFGPSFLGGLLYIFSGTFTWFISLEQLVNVAMVAPALFLAVELLAVRALLRDIAYTAFAIGMLLLAGQPEVAFYIGFFATLYYIMRRLTIFGFRGGLRAGGVFVLSGVLGLMIAAPLLLPFVELWANAHHIHPVGGKMGVQTIGHWMKLLPLLFPTGAEMMQDPSIVKGICQLTYQSGGWFRYLPINGVWDALGGFTGVASLFLIITGLISLLRLSRSHLRGPLLFFVAVALIIILKNTGIRPFLWLGNLPLFDQVWSLRWAGPVWTFSLAVGAALGLQSIMSARLGSIPAARLNVGKDVMAPHPFFLKISKTLENGPRIAPVLAFVIIAIFYVAFLAVPTIILPLNAGEIFSPALAPYARPSIGGATLVFILILIIILFLTLRYVTINKGFSAIIAIAALELWWAVPRGYAPDFLDYKWILFAEGFLIVLLLRKEWTVTAGIIVLLFIASLWYLDEESPRGWPVRSDPFVEAPYVAFIKARQEAGAGFRTVGAGGALMPNYASAVGLRDLRYVNSLISKEFHDFRTKNLHATVIEEEPVSSLWFTGMAERCEVRRGAHGRVGYGSFLRPIEDDFKGEPLAHYSLLGVRYIVVPKSISLPLPLKRIYNAEVRVYENPNALKRARLDFTDGKKGRAGIATIKEDSPNRLVIEVDATSDAKLILADIYYPGWKATVNGSPVEIKRSTDILRSLPIKKGLSQVIFTYEPRPFKVGILLSALALIICIGLRLRSKS